MKRTIKDPMGRYEWQEWNCVKCHKWVHEKDVVWVKTTPYCKKCSSSDQNQNISYSEIDLIINS